MAAALLAAALTSAFAGPARAQGAPVVAAAGDIQLTAEPDARFGGVELGLRGPGVDNAQLGRVPIWADQAVLVEDATDNVEEAQQRLFLGGAVAAAVATVDVELQDGRRSSAATSAGEAYAGLGAGRMRFFVLDLGTGEPSVRLVRMLDGAGQVIGAVEDGEAKGVAGPVTFGSPANPRVRFRAYVSEALAATALVPDRLERRLCVRLDIRANGQTGVTDACDRPAPGFPALSIVGARGCGTFPTGFVGLVPPETRRVMADLGEGSTVVFTPQAVPAAFGVTRRAMFGGVVPRGRAIRRFTAFDAGGKPIAGVEARVAPGQLPCARGEVKSRQGNADFFDLPSEQPATPADLPATQVAVDPPGDGPRLVARDEGEYLCVGIDRLRADRSDCGRPPVGAAQPAIEERTEGGGMVIGIVPPAVMAVDIRFEGGAVQRVTTTEGDGYTGAYRGRVRFLAATTGGRHVSGARLLDGNGASLGDMDDAPYNALEDADRMTRGPIPIASRGFLRLVAGRVDELRAGKRVGFPCFALSVRGSTAPPDDCEATATSVSALKMQALCLPRALVLYGVAQRAAKRVEVNLVGGRRIRARLVAFPAKLGVKAKGFMVVLPRRARVVDVRFAGQLVESGLRNRIFTAHAAAAPQCGWRFSDAL